MKKAMKKFSTVTSHNNFKDIMVLNSAFIKTGKGENLILGGIENVEDMEVVKSLKKPLFVLCLMEDGRVRKISYMDIIKSRSSDINESVDDVKDCETTEEYYSGTEMAEEGHLTESSDEEELEIIPTSPIKRKRPVKNIKKKKNTKTPKKKKRRKK